jgi:hypothetical protein
MRNETAAAAVAAAASLLVVVIRRTSGHILQSRPAAAAVSACGRRAEDCALVEHPQAAAGWHCERSEPATVFAWY